MQWSRSCTCCVDGAVTKRATGHTISCIEFIQATLSIISNIPDKCTIGKCTYVGGNSNTNHDSAHISTTNKATTMTIDHRDIINFSSSSFLVLLLLIPFLKVVMVVAQAWGIPQKTKIHMTPLSFQDIHNSTKQKLQKPMQQPRKETVWRPHSALTGSLLW